MNTSFRNKTLLLAIVLVLLAVNICMAAEEGQRPRGRGRGLYGDYIVKMTFNERQFESILSFTRDAEGDRKAYWISFFGMQELKDVKLEEGQLTFYYERQNREGQTSKTTFKGAIQEGKLSGTFTSGRGEWQATGERAPRVPRAVGTWEIKFKVGEREITSKLIITAGKENTVNVSWPGERVKHVISDAQYSRGRLTFNTKSSMDERKWESAVEARLSGDTLTGTIKSGEREMAVTGKRANATAIGTWVLDIKSERGERKQRLRINGDMSARYGALPIKKITLDDAKVSFPIVLKFGEREFTMNFKGEIKEGKLTGEITSERGTQKVTGTKLVRPTRRPRGQRTNQSNP